MILSPDVPLVGQPVKLIQHYHTYVVQCGCDAKTISVIVGDGQGHICPACGGLPMARLEQARVQLGFGRPLADVTMQ